MRLLASCCLLVAGCGRIGFDATAPGTTVTGAPASIAAGTGFSCAVKDGSVWCWGRSDAHQLGIDTLSPQPTPAQVPLNARAVRVAANDAGACALDDAGGVWCWGNGALPSQIAGLPRPATTLSAGGAHACAVLDDATLWCWGGNASGEVGVDPAMPVVATPVQVLTGAQEVAAGSSFTCARKNDASVWCWGGNLRGTLGDGTTTDHFTPAAVPGLAASAIAAGLDHVCVLDAAGHGLCWGSDDEGQLGIDPPQSHPSPIAVMQDVPFAAIAAGDYTSCAIDGQGGAWCWGNGNDGEQGDGYRFDHATPTPLGVTGVVAIAEGDSHGCLEHADATVACWGYGSHGELGDGRIAALVPRKVPLPGAADFITAGKHHACALLTSGNLAYCWGSNGAAELGVRDDTNPQGSSLTPVQVPVAGTNGVWAGDETTCALISGDIVCWGRNDDGQAGSMPLEYAHPPTTVAGLPTPNGASCSGQLFSCTGNANGIECWGTDSYGQLGDSGGGGGPTPVMVGTGSQPACGDQFACALSNSSVACWGANPDGELGIGSSDGSLHKLTGIVGGASYSKVAAGAHHACAQRANPQTVDCWGNNTSGQLGDGTTTSRTQPVPVSNLTNVGSIATGGDTTCATDGNFVVQCWGANDVGQIGDGTMLGRLVPTAAPVMAFQVAVGESFACALTTTSDIVCWGDNDDGQIGSGPQTRALSPVNVAFP